MLKNWWKFLESQILPLLGSGLMVAGWNWYHLARRPHLRWALISAALWVGVWGGYWLFKHLYTHLVRRFRRHPFWQHEFRGWLDNLFVLGSLWWLVFFFKHELGALIYLALIGAIIFWRLQRYLGHHPAATPWLAVNRAVFALAGLIWFSQALFQYLSWRWYILDPAARFPNIVLFRTLALSALWLAGFMVAQFIYWHLKGPLRYLLTTIWSLAWLAFIFAWMVNLGVLYFSGLQFGPVALEHLKSSEALLLNSATIVPALGFIVLAAGFGLVFRLVSRAYTEAPKRYWYFYQAGALLFCLVVLVGFSSLRTTPEHTIIKSFVDYYRGTDGVATLDPAVQAKLERFGLRYRPEEFFVAAHDYVFSPSSTIPLVPARFKTQPPNIIIIFLESFSTRLNSVYNPRFKELTPGLEDMAADKNTTIFKKYYNASTPTITGIISLLCSWLPSTGHEEIERGRQVQRLRLSCLPEILKQQGFKNTTYMTAVPRTFANKGSLFESMGADQVLAQEELSRLIKGKPLAWGYSDHQMFPVLWNLVAKAEAPFLAMLSTVDSHPPFTSAKDIVPWRNSRSNLLNSVHTTDNAFRVFWQAFRQSPLADNTILVAVADHAVFPAAYSHDIVPFIGQADMESYRTFYDENTFLLYVPDSSLPKEVAQYSSGLDFTPTLLHLLGLNIPNSFEGHSIFDDRDQYPNLLGMHELGLYINQLETDGRRTVDYNIPSQIQCPPSVAEPDRPELTLCEYLHFYRWKRAMFEQGRFWKRP